MSNLTQKWKEGKLEKGKYYVQFPNGKVEICGIYELCCFRLSADGDKIKVLAEVPNYLVWQYMCNLSATEHHINNFYFSQIYKLTQLLKECHSAFCRNLVENEELTKDETITLLTKIEKEIGVNNGKKAG